MINLLREMSATHLLAVVLALALVTGGAIVLGTESPATSDENGVAAYTLDEDVSNGTATITFHGNASVDKVRIHAAATNGTYTLSSPNESLTLNTTQTGKLTITQITTTADGTETAQTTTYTPTVPTVALTPTTASVAVNTTVTFDASASTTNGGDHLAFAWDTDGDGTFDQTTAGSTIDVPFTTPGTYRVSVRVDNGNQSATKTATIHVENAAPELTLSAPGNATVNESVTASVAAIDSDGHPLTVEWTIDNTTVATQSGSTLTTDFTTTGQHTITATVSDGYTTATVTQSITVVAPETNTTTETNTTSTTNSTTLIVEVDGSSGSDGDDTTDTDSTPVVSASADFAVYNNTSAEFTATAESGDLPLTYEWTFGDGSTGVGTNPTHPYTTRGTYTATVTLTDADGDSASEAVNVTVTNTPPVAVTSPNQTVTDNESFTLTANASTDYDGDALSYTWQTATGEVVSGLNLTDTLGSFGSYTYTLNVTDAYNASDTDTVTVTVVNHAPSIDAAAVNRTTVSDTEFIAFTADASDPDTGDALSYNWSFDDGNSSTAQNTTHAYSSFGTYNATLTVTDEHGATNSTTIQISVENTAPTIDTATVNRSAVSDGEDIAFTATASDPDKGDTLSYEWNFSDGNTSAGANTTHAYSAFGTYNATLTVTDEHGASDSTTLPTITVENNAPVVTPLSNTSVLEGDAISYNASSSYDPDTGDNISIEWTLGDGNTSTGETVTHTYADESWYTVEVTVTDEHGATNNSTATVHVDNAAPVAALTGPSNAEPDATVTFNASDTDDPDNDTLTYDYDFDNDGTYECTDCGEAASTTYSTEGTYTATVRVTDGDGGDDTATHSITVEYTVSTSGLVAFWEMVDDTTPSTLVDAHGPHNGSIYNQIYTSTSRGTVLHFNDSNNDYSEVPHNSSLNVGGHQGDATWTGWVHIDADTGTKEVFFGKQRDLCTGCNNFQYQIRAFDKNSGGDMGLQFVTNDGYEGGGWHVVTATDSLPVGQWVHWAITYNSSTGTLTFYRNGTEISTKSFAVSNFPTDGNTYPIEFGRWKGKQRPLVGEQSHIAVYNQQLNSSQINDHYNATK